MFIMCIYIYMHITHTYNIYIYIQGCVRPCLIDLGLVTSRGFKLPATCGEAAHKLFQY